MAIPIIMNPAARSTQAARAVQRVAALKPTPQLHFTAYPGHATLIAEQLAREGHPLVVAAGGDGTVNEVLQGLCRVNAERPDPDTHCALGTLPAGTMNVFAYESGFPSHRDIEHPWRVITAGTRRTIDLWMANDLYFLQLAGVGLDAEIVRRTTWDMKKRYGPLSYAMSAMNVLSSEQPLLSVQVPDRPEMDASLVLVGNGRNYGGRFPMFRDAQSSDGLLDVIVLRGRLHGLHAWQILRGTWLDGYDLAEDVDYLQAESLTVTGDRPAAMQLDGELAGESPVTFRRAPFSLRVASLG
jgi:YegS/Rv2252/BmrU family lipid kinase